MTFTSIPKAVSFAAVLLHTASAGCLDYVANTEVSAAAGPLLVIDDVSFPGTCCSSCRSTPGCLAWDWQVLGMLKWSSAAVQEDVQYHFRCELYGAGTTQQAAIPTEGSVGDVTPDPQGGYQEIPYKRWASYSLQHDDCSCGGQFHCGAGDCVEQPQVCDGVNDCLGGSDEVNCTPAPTLPPATFAKYDGIKLDTSAVVADGWACLALCQNDELCAGWNFWAHSGWCALAVDTSSAQVTKFPVIAATENNVCSKFDSDDKQFLLANAANTLISNNAVADDSACCAACTADASCVAFHFKYQSKKCAMFSTIDTAATKTVTQQSIVATMQR